MSRKNKFDLTHLVHSGTMKDGDVIYFVTDPSKYATVCKQPNGEYKLRCGVDILTVHAASALFLGQEPADHASKWLRTAGGKTLYELWQEEQELAEAA